MSAKSFLLVVALGLLAPAAFAAERGSAGLVEIPFTARNDAASEISCEASLAHWYSVALGRAAPGAEVSVSFWRDLKSGTLYLLNESEDRMAVQMAWCGFAGRNWQTRSVVTPAADKPISLTCVSEADKLVCR